MQALIRGKAVLCFGDASYIGFEHCYKIRNVSDVELAYKKIINTTENVSQSFKDYLFKTDKISISGVEKELDDFYGEDNRLNSGGRILNLVLTLQDSICSIE